MTLNTPHDSCFFTLLTDNVHLYNQHMLLGLGRIDSAHITQCNIYLLYQSVWEYIASVSRVSMSRHPYQLLLTCHLPQSAGKFLLNTYLLVTLYSDWHLHHTVSCSYIIGQIQAGWSKVQTCFFCFKLHLFKSNICLTSSHIPPSFSLSGLCGDKDKLMHNKYLPGNKSSQCVEC